MCRKKKCEALDIAQKVEMDIENYNQEDGSIECADKYIIVCIMGLKPSPSGETFR